MGSMHWTDEEAKYLKAVFQWHANTSSDKSSRASRSSFSLLKSAGVKKKPPAGEFRVLVVGAKGCGKTSILTRFCVNTFRGESEPADPFFERGCRHPIELLLDADQNGPVHGNARNTGTYVVDALEMPSKHLPSNLMLEQALNITEGAVLVYDVADAASLRLAVKVHDFIRDSLLGGGEGGDSDRTEEGGAAASGISQPGRRQYALLLVGNKSDVDDEDRAVPWAEGSRTAASFKVRCAFMEASAKTGENVANIFPTLCREILRMKRLNRQRREEADQAALLKLKAQAGAPSSAGRRRGIWRALINPFSRRRDGQLR